MPCVPYLTDCDLFVRKCEACLLVSLVERSHRNYGSTAELQFYESDKKKLHGQVEKSSVLAG